MHYLGVLIWIVWMLLMRPHPMTVEWAHAILLFVPLVLFPLAWALTCPPDSYGSHRRLARSITYLQLPAAVSLSVAYSMSQGLIASVFAMPWLVTTILVSVYGATRIGRAGRRTLWQLTADTGLILIAVGGTWAVADRYGFRPLDFEPVIVLLTAIHFHYAGFCLPIVTSMAARQLPGRQATCATAGVIIGIPLVAVGITFSQLGLGTGMETTAALLAAFGAAVVGVLHVRLAWQSMFQRGIRALWSIAGVSLLAGMVLAALYGSRFHLPVAWLDIPTMRVLHGTTIAFGFSATSIVGWTIFARHEAIGLNHPANPEAR